MMKILCLFPKEKSTEFLRPIYEKLCEIENVVGFDNDAVEDDDYFEKLEKHLQDSEFLIFLGHGSSGTLFGTNFNPIIDDKTGNMCYLKGKKLLIFSCKSVDYIKNYKLNNAIGFGFIPTSKDDAHEGSNLHGMNISVLDKDDFQVFRNSIVNIWLKTINNSEWQNPYRFLCDFSFYTDIEIVNVLLYHKKITNYRLVADMLYYLKLDMKYIE